jgi:hypothetical protein
MLTIDKFRDAVTGHFARSRVLWWSAIAAFVLAFCGAWLGVPVLFPVGYLQSQVMAGLLLSLIAFLVVAAGGAAWCNERRSRRDPRRNCPHCGAALELHGPIVIATRNCPRCGRRVLSDPGPPD